MIKITLAYLLVACIYCNQLMHDDSCVDIYPRCADHRGKCSLPKDNVWFKWVSKECRKTCDLCPKVPTTGLPITGCGQSSVPMSRVIGGEYAKKGAWPWIARLYRANTKLSYCGGSLISPTWVVTAAHCVQRKSGKDVDVHLGRYTLYESPIDPYVQKIPVKRIILHPKRSKEGRFSNDVALLELSRPAKLNDRVNPICLPEHDKPVPVGTECFVAGWGKYQRSGGSSKALRQSKLKIVSNKYCSSVTQDTVGTRVRDSMVCASLGQNTVNNACQGDSGGPLMCKQNNRFILHGDVSWGHPTCGKGMSVFGRMTEFRKWIDQYVK